MVKAKSQTEEQQEEQEVGRKEAGREEVERKTGGAACRRWVDVFLDSS